MRPSAPGAFLRLRMGNSDAKSPAAFSSHAFLAGCYSGFGRNGLPRDIAPVQSHSLAHAHLGVFVTINNSGPYEFMVDTGAQITMLDSSLAQELKLEASGLLSLVTVTSDQEVPLVSAAIVEVGPVSVQGMRMAVEDFASLDREAPTLRGILGTDFLSRFDILLDNRHKSLCFDDSHRRQQSLLGEQLPILSINHQSSASAPAILVSVHLPDDGKQGSILRLDSGSNVPLLYVDTQATAMSLAHATPVSGVTIGRQAQFAYVYTPPRRARFGAHTEMQIAFAVKLGSSLLYSKAGEVGLLPTRLFKRVFISAADHFVIFDPR